MTVVTAASTLLQDDGAITLPRYAQLIEYEECHFFGVHNPNLEQWDCRTIWTKHERDTILKYLNEAQEEIEAIVGYPLQPTWITDEQHDYALPILADWGYVIAGGVLGSTDIALGETVDHTADPAVVGPVATTVTDEDEIRVYHPGSEVEIHPSDIAIAGGTVTITIPRCRMVTEALCDNPKTGLDYTELANFEATVDIKRVYNDPSTHAVLVWQHGNSLCSATCDEDTQTGCIYVNDAVIGSVDVLPANYSGGSWTRRSLTCCSSMPQVVRLNYRAGMNPLTFQAEDAILRLAHAKMPFAPCTCDIAMRVWQRDRNVPEVLSRERYNCPFGMSDGAWIAWRFAVTMKLFRGGVL
jgi:hypothetical protein